MHTVEIYENAGADAPFIVLCTSSKDDRIEKLCLEVKKLTDVAFNLAVFKADDWNHDYSPWETSGMDPETPFTGGGEKSLEKLSEMIGSLKEKYSGKIYVAGYSLAGLFALWSLYRTNLFDGAICCSGSLWFSDFIDFAKQRSILTDSIVYLSLGGKEEKVNHPVVSTIGIKTKEMDRILDCDKRVLKHKLEMNSGGHFADSSKRLAKGIAWILKNI